MIHRLPTNCRNKLLHLWARLHTDTTINEVTHLNRAEWCERVAFLYSQSSLTVLMNDPQTANELPKKIISFVGEAGPRRINKSNYCSELRRTARKYRYLHSQCSLTVLINDPQAADKLPTNIISFAGEAADRRNHK